MKKSEKFVITHMFSDIPGIQEAAVDTYEVIGTKTCVIITYSCKCINKPLVKASYIAPISFSAAKNLAIFLSENACRENNWIDVINDYICKLVKIEEK